MIRRAALAVLGAVGARAALGPLRHSGYAPRLARTNFRGRTVSLAGGPALAVSASFTAAAGAPSPAGAAGALIAGLTSGAVGLYDDVAADRHFTVRLPGRRTVDLDVEHKQAKGFRGHFGALRHGRVTTGLIKITGVGLAGLAASTLLQADRPRTGVLRSTVDVLLGAGVIAGTANLLNLFDLRPGRASKVALLAGTPLVAGPAGGYVAGPLGAVAGVLPDDLREEVMLGDCGANAIGALLGVGLVARTGTVGRATLLAGLAALTAASEKVSFTQVIARTPGLRELDQLGRLPS